MLLARVDDSNLSVRGEATLATAAELLAELRAALDAGPVDGIDLTGICAIDIAGYQVLSSFTATAGAEVRGVSQPIERFCAITGLGRPGGTAS